MDDLLFLLGLVVIDCSVVGVIRVDVIFSVAVAAVLLPHTE